MTLHSPSRLCRRHANLVAAANVVNGEPLCGNCHREDMLRLAAMAVGFYADERGIYVPRDASGNALEVRP